MIDKVLNLLEVNGLDNDLSLPAWIYQVENITVKNKRFLKIYFFNRYFTFAEPNQILLTHQNKPYVCDRFETVSEYNNQNVFGTVIEIDIDDVSSDVTITKEIIGGEVFSSGGDTVKFHRNIVLPEGYEYVMKKLGLRFYPMFANKYWQCTCGRINNSNEDCRCGESFNDVRKILTFDAKAGMLSDYVDENPIKLSVDDSFENNLNRYVSLVSNAVKNVSESDIINKLDISSLKARYDTLVNEHRQRKQKQEEAARAMAEKKKKTRRTVLTVIFTIAIVSALIAGYVFVLNPMIKGSSLKGKLKDLTSENVGETIEIGTYYHSADSSGTRPLEWLILDVDDEWVLLITNSIIDAHNYHEQNSIPSEGFASTSLHHWLNSDFYNEALSGYSSVLVSFDGEGLVTILSSAEAKNYLPYKAGVQPASYTDYAENKLKDLVSDYGKWWLKDYATNGSGVTMSFVVSEDGSIGKSSPSNSGIGVRPVIKVKLK